MKRIGNTEAILRSRARKKENANILRTEKIISVRSDKGKYTQRLVKEFNYVIQLRF